MVITAEIHRVKEIRQDGCELAKEKTEVKEEVKPVVKNPYKIGDFVKWYSLEDKQWYSLEDKQEVVGVYENYVWLISLGRPVPFSKEYHAVSPWVEPIKLKYKKGDLVLRDGNVFEIINVVSTGYHMKNISQGYICPQVFNDGEIIRKVGVAVKA